jgi:hypothetical protein
MMIEKFRKITEIEAVQFDGDNLAEVLQFISDMANVIGVNIEKHIDDESINFDVHYTDKSRGCFNLSAGAWVVENLQHKPLAYDPEEFAREFTAVGREVK